MSRASGLTSPRGQAVMLAALLLLVFTAFPFAWMASTALKPSREIFVTPPTLWPAHVTLDNLSRLFEETLFLTYFRNSLAVSSATVGLTLLVSVPAAYSLTRFRFPAREQLAGLILFTYMFAPIMIIIPFFVAMRFLGLTNTHLGLILAYTAFCLPFNLWLLRTFFQSIPLELEEAALVDGCSRYRIFWSIVLPLSKPGLAATFILVLIMAWNEYLFALFLSSANAQTLPLTVAAQNATRGPQWWYMSVLIIIMIVPVSALALLLARYITRGLLIGAVKG
jgi:multiple sugar transport system permease protein